MVYLFIEQKKWQNNFKMIFLLIDTTLLKSIANLWEKIGKIAIKCVFLNRYPHGYQPRQIQSVLLKIVT